LYKSCASQSGLNGAEVVGVIAPLSAGEITVHEDRVTTEETIADPITIEQPSQEELQGVTHTVSLASELVKTNSKALNLAFVIDEFDTDMMNLMSVRHIYVYVNVDVIVVRLRFMQQKWRVWIWEARVDQSRSMYHLFQ
jgi:hypothetical protein